MSQNNDAKMDLNAFIKKYWKFLCLVAAIVVVVIIVVVVAVSKNKSADNSESLYDTQTGEELYQVDANSQINDLITNYYTYYANGDTDSIAAIATPLSDKEASFIQMYSQYVESYNNISCYTKSGLADGDYLVSAYVEIKFNGIETLAPGLDFFYVQTNDDGSYYINNLYCQYNQMINRELPLDETIEDLITQFEDQSDVIALSADVTTKYEEAINADEALSTMVNTTIRDAYTAWAQAQQEETEVPQETEAVTETPAETEAEAEPTTTTVYTIDRVNVRDAADTSGNLLGTIDAGTAVTMIGDGGNGWAIVDYNGTNAYIKSDYLSVEAPAATGTDTSSDSGDTSAAGETITISETCNIRASMSSDGEKVGTAYPGEQVTVVESYAEGWTKVTWNGKTGYIRSDLLK